MRLLIKTLQQQTILLEFDETRTVWDLKVQLWENSEVCIPPEYQKIIYAGRALCNADVVRGYCIDQRKFLVVLEFKPEDEPAKNVKPKNDDSTPAKDTEKPGPSKYAGKFRSEEEPSTSATVVKPHGAAVDRRKSTELPLPLKINEELMRSVVSMGYSEADARRAIAAGCNNADRVIEHLLVNYPPRSASTLELALEQASESASTSLRASMSALALTPSLDDNVNRGPKQSIFDFLRSDTNFIYLRRVIQSRPDMLSTVLGKLCELTPKLLDLINNNQDEFVDILNEPEDDNKDGLEEAVEIIEVVLTDDEKRAVNRLIALGFPRDLVIHAYLACKRNEKKTADFLCREADST